MAAAGLDIDGRHRFDGKEFAIEFNLSLAFENEIHLGHSFVIMRAGILLDIDHVQAGGMALRAGKGAAGQTAWAFDRGNLIELCDEVLGYQEALGSAWGFSSMGGMLWLAGGVNHRVSA